MPPGMLCGRVHHHPSLIEYAAPHQGLKVSAEQGFSGKLRREVGKLRRETELQDVLKHLKPSSIQQDPTDPTLPQHQPLHEIKAVT